MIFFMKKGILLIADITSDVTQKMTTLIWMSTENISTIADMDSCCSDSNASDGLRKLSCYRNINLPIIFFYLFRLQKENAIKDQEYPHTECF